MSEFELTYREYYLYFVVGAAVFGALIGVVPLLLGARRGKGRLGWIALISSAIAGAVLGPILSLIVVAIFSVVILRGGGSGNNETTSAAE